MTVGERIKKLRKERRITQVQLSKATGISQSSISDLEKLTNNPSTVTLQLIAKALNCSVSLLLGEDEKEKETQDDAWAIRERLRRDPSYRLLFDAADTASPEHLRAAAAMLKALEGESKNDE